MAWTYIQADGLGDLEGPSQSQSSEGTERLMGWEGKKSNLQSFQDEEDLKLGSP
jgi:hypothetical protein